MSVKGRPRKLPLDQALEAALRLFWERGYESTSVGELSKTLGVGPSSLYNDFGSKRGLYQRCLESYVAREGTFLLEALAKDDVRDALRTAFVSAATLYAREEVPRGCAVISAPVARDEEVERTLREMRAKTRELIEARIARGVEEAQLPAETDVPGLARYAFGVLGALSAQARDGASEDELQALARRASRAIDD